MEEELLAFDTSGMPVNPAVGGFQSLGEVQGSAMSNAYLAELEAERMRNMPVREKIMLANQAARAEQQAMKMAGQLEYQQLIQGGNTPEEALRRTAHKIFFNTPAGLATALKATRPDPRFQPTMTQTEGGRIFQAGPERAQFIPDKPPTPPPDAKARLDLLKAKHRGMTSGMAGVTADPKALAALEEEIMRSSTNWMDKASAPAVASTAAPTTSTATQSPYKEGEIIRSKKTGKRYRVENGQPVELSQ